MKRTLCFLLLLLAALTLCACGNGLSAPDAGAVTTAAAPSHTEAATLPNPGDVLSEEEQLAMWRAVIEEMSKDDLTQEKALAKAESELALLEACGTELLAMDLPESDSFWEVAPLHESWMVLYEANSRSLRDFESENCHRLLSFEIAEYIRVWDGCVRFAIGGRGFGPETEYYDVYYIPSDDLTGCFGYQSGMTFAEQDGGWFGRFDDPRDDDSFFYRKLGEHLYFCCAHF